MGRHERQPGKLSFPALAAQGLYAAVKTLLEHI
jgi:hypothetical protein